MKIEKEDFLYLLEMTYGYIDDELGGMDEANKNSIKLTQILNKYGISEQEIKARLI